MPTFGPTNPDRDATLVNGAAYDNTNWGASNIVYLDYGPGAYLATRPVLAWDVSGIPLGAVVTSATLDFVIQSNGLSGATACGVYPMTHAETGGVVFVEGTGTGTATGDGATWLTTDGTTAWDSGGGGDINATFKSAFSVTSGETTKSINATTAIQSALNTYRDSNGRIALLLKRDTESGASNLLRFWSLQAAVGANRPTLTIVYTVGGNTYKALTGVGR